MGIEQESLAFSALNTAHDVVLEGMGEDGVHPGPLLSAELDVLAGPQGWHLRVTLTDGTVRQAFWRTAF